MKLYASFPIVGIVVDGKYQFFDGDDVDMAFDLGVSYAGIAVGDVDATFLDFYPALLMTYNFSEKFSATLAPKVLTRRFSSDTETYTESYPGATLTIAIGGKFRIMPEVGVYKGKDSLGQDIQFTHWGVGLNF